MAFTKRRGWTLLVIPDDEAQTRQFRIPRTVVRTIIIVSVLLVVYALVETILFWMVARRAAQVEPLKRKVRELENSNEELAHLGQEVTKLRNFEKKLRGVLSGRESGNTLDELPWNESELNADRTQSSLRKEKTGGTGSETSGELRNPGISFTASDVPTLPPVRGFVTRGFTTPQSYLSSAHFGVDLVAKEGTPILAAADGLVVFSDWTYRYGNLVVLAHRSGFISFYGHNQTLFARSGSWVRQGEPIATLGNSGISTAPHIHFELWLDGSPMDPRTLLRIAP